MLEERWKARMSQVTQEERTEGKVCSRKEATYKGPGAGRNSLVYPELRVQERKMRDVRQGVS